MTRSELEYDLMKIIAIRMIGWKADNCLLEAKTWAPKVIAAFPDLFPGIKVEATVAAQITPTVKTQGTSTYQPAQNKPRTVGRKT
jgi:beta-lactamase regulating signal transducer with metallopeptidase domain